MPKSKLTVKGIRALPAPSKGRVEYWDEVQAGLVLRVTSSGKKTFSCMYRRKSDGKRCRVTIGEWAETTENGRTSLADARDEAKAIRGEVAQGGDPAEEQREQREAVTFEQLSEEYLTHHAKPHLVEKSYRAHRNKIRKVLVPRWGSMKAGDLRRRDVVLLLDEYMEDGSPYARNRTAALISKVFNVGLDRDVPGLEGNPATGLVDPRLEKPRRRTLSDDEMKKVLPLFREQGMAGLGFELLLLTGQRPREVFEMEWSEVDGDTWALPTARTKLRHSDNAPEHHLVPLSPQARAVLAKLKAHRKQGNPHVFPSPAKKDTPFTEYSGQASDVREKADLDEDFYIKDLRGTVLTGLQRLGVPGAVISAVACHLPQNTTRRHYSMHDFADEKREALDAWGAHVEKLDPATKGKVVKLARHA